MDYLANYYTQSNIVPISNCIRNRIVNGKDYICDNNITKNFLDTAGEEPYNIFHPVEKYKNEIKKLKEENEKLNSQVKKLEEELKKKLQEAADNVINTQPVMNGGIVKSPDEKYLLGLIVQPLDPKDKDKYPALAKRGDKKNDFLTISIMTNRKLRRKLGMKENLGQVMENLGFNNEDDTMIGDYGIAFVGHSISKEPHFVESRARDIRYNIRTENLNKWAGKFPVKKKESFIDLPKKNNRLAYVIFFILALVLFLKLKK